MPELYLVKPRIMAGIVLDCSSSMYYMRREAINHFNESVQAIRERAEGMEARISLVTFSRKVSCPIFNEPVGRVQELTDQDYLLSGGTALYDGILYMIHRLTKEVNTVGRKHTSVMVSVITDGEENSSVHYPGERGRGAIRRWISRLEETGRWSFTFMGTDRRVLEEDVHDLGFSRGNTSLYQATSQGMSEANYHSACSFVRFIDEVQDGGPAPRDLLQDSEPPDDDEGGPGVLH